MRRAGFALIEMLVAIAIIAILVAILLPAVQYSRESARRIHCSSNLRQIALAIHTYEGEHRSLPPGNASTYSFLVSILPQMEMLPLYDRFDFGRYAQNQNPTFQAYLLELSFPHYRCPSDGVSRGRPYTTNYAGNIGYDITTLGYNGVFHGESITGNPAWRGSVYRFSEITDGLSGTGLIGEILGGDGPTNSRLRTNWATATSFGPGQHEQFCTACLTHQYKTFPNGVVFGDGFRAPWYEGVPGYTLYSHCLPPNSESCINGSSVSDGIYTLSSNHSGGAQVAFADAHLDFISSQIDRAVWRSLGSRSGDEPN